MRDIGIVPNYSSEYKAISVYKYLTTDDLGETRILDQIDFLESVFLLFSLSMQISELFLFDKAVAASSEEKELKMKV